MFYLIESYISLIDVLNLSLQTVTLAQEGRHRRVDSTSVDSGRPEEHESTRRVTKRGNDDETCRRSFETSRR